MSISGGNELFLPLSVEPLSSLVGVTGGLLTARRASLKRARAPSTLRLIPRKPSVSTDGETDETDSATDFSPGRAAAGVRSFHNATIFRTEASGDRGEVCGLRNPDGGVMEVRVNEPVSE
jgi:hypothetical protein